MQAVLRLYKDVDCIMLLEVKHRQLHGYSCVLFANSLATTRKQPEQQI